MSIQEKFNAAVNVIENLPSDGTFQPSEDLMLKMHAYYMQATEGPCRIPKPTVWYYASRVKWSAWNDLGNMPKEVAMEKYVEELTKVIETMSYNENVSKFMSLLGPFYEVVSTDEVDAEYDKRLNNKNLTEYTYPVKSFDCQTGNESELSQLRSCMLDNATMDKSSSSETQTKSSENHKSNLSDNLNMKYVPRKNMIDLLKAKSKSKKQPFGSKQDILILTFINLQNSLEGIVKKLDYLQTLAKSADLSNETEEEEEETLKEWELGYGGSTFALLWPIALYFWSRRM